jgi:hypothetical protein
MTDREELGDRLDAVEDDLATGDTRPLFVLADGDGYVTLDGEPAPEESGALFALTPEVTENWERTDGDGARGDG